MKFPTWLSARAFFIATLLSVILDYDYAAKTGFSTEGVVGWVVASVVGGVILGAALTWVEKKFRKS